MIEFTPAGRLAQLRRLARAGVSLGLFINADAGTAFEEPGVAEYAPIRVPVGDWVIDIKAETGTVPERGWTFTSEIPFVHGWFARVDGEIEFFERFPQPLTVNQIGDQIRVAIELTPI